MKKAITIILVLLSVTVFGQKDSTKVPADSIALISKKDIQEFLVWMGNNVSKTAYETSTPEQILNLLYKHSVEIWIGKKKKANK